MADEPQHVMDAGARFDAEMAMSPIARTDTGAQIIRLETPAVRAELEEQAIRDAAHAEALRMLEKMADAIADAAAGGTRCTGVVIAVVFEDGSYGRLFPERGINMGHLIGAIESAKLDMIAKVR